MPRQKTTEPTLFGRKLEELRKDRGLTQADLADALDISRGTIAYYEAKAKNPTFESLKSIAEYFGVPVDYFFVEAEPESRPGPVSRLERQVRRIRRLSPAKQRMISDMLEAALNAK